MPDVLVEPQITSSKKSIKIIVGILAPLVAFIASAAISPCNRGMGDYFVKPAPPLPVICKFVDPVDSIISLVLVILLFIGLVLLILNILQGVLRLNIVTEIKAKAFLTVSIFFSAIIIFIRLISIVLGLLG